MINKIIIIRNTEIRKLSELPRRILIYGRRKTGKTFLVKNYFKKAHYFFVKRGGGVFYENAKKSLDYDVFIAILDRLIEEKRIVVVDEFHRLPDEFLDFLHYRSPEKIILVTSTLHLAKKIMGRKSPILGLVHELRINPIDERDILVNLSKYIKDPKKLVEYSVYLREPILLGFLGRNLANIINEFKLTVPSLVGEIFEEEERTLSEKYEGIIRAIAVGKRHIGRIADFLHSKNIIKTSEHGKITPYIKTLLDMGLIKRIPEYGSRRYSYFVSSPMIDLYYYLDEKYNFSESELDEKYFFEKLPFHIENFFRELLSKLYKKRCFIINKPHLEVDIALGDFKKLTLVAEVKWKNKLGKKELYAIEEKMANFKRCEKVLIVPDKKIVPEKPKNMKVFGVKEILAMCEKKNKTAYSL